MASGSRTKLAIGGLASSRIEIAFDDAELQGTGNSWIGSAASAVVDAIDVDHPLLYLE